MAEKPPYDVVVIGAGPGGYVAAIRAAQLGLRTACVEKDERLGGTCLNVGCIPSKALLESSEIYHLARTGLAEHGVRTAGVELDLATMMRRKDAIVSGFTKGIESLFRKNRIDRLRGSATLAGPRTLAITGPDGTRSSAEARSIVLATGSEPSPLPWIPFDAERVVTSTEALAWTEVPARLAVVGAGAIGIEIGSVWARLGSSVTVFEFLPAILPGVDGEIAKLAERLLTRQGLRFLKGMRVTSVEVAGSEARLRAEPVAGGAAPAEWKVDRVLVAVGRRPATAGLGLEAAGIALDDRGRVRVNERNETIAAGVYAIGDLVEGPMLAHKASEEGIAVAETIAGKPGHVNREAIPAIVYTSPEIASVGQTEEDLRKAGRRYRKGTFPFQANGRARALGSTDGLAKILADEASDRILGVHILGPRAGDLVAEMVLAVEFSASSEDVARTSHAHPTLAEVVKEAALAVEGRAIHL